STSTGSNTTTTTTNSRMLLSYHLRRLLSSHHLRPRRACTTCRPRHRLLRRSILRYRLTSSAAPQGTPGGADATAANGERASSPADPAKEDRSAEKPTRPTLRPAV